MCSESVDELFVATFDCIRDSAADAIKRTCELVGKCTILVLLSASGITLGIQCGTAY